MVRHCGIMIPDSEAQPQLSHLGSGLSRVIDWAPGRTHSGREFWQHHQLDSASEKIVGWGSLVTKAANVCGSDEDPGVLLFSFLLWTIFFQGVSSWLWVTPDWGMDGVGKMLFMLFYVAILSFRAPQSSNAAFCGTELSQSYLHKFIVVYCFSWPSGGRQALGSSSLPYCWCHWTPFLFFTAYSAV